MLKISIYEALNAFCIGALVYCSFKIIEIFSQDLVKIVFFFILTTLIVITYLKIKYLFISSLLYVLYILFSSITLFYLNQLLFYETLDLESVIMNYALAWSLAILIPGLPGGLGARELIFASLFFDENMAPTLIILIILHRIGTLAVEILAYLIFQKKLI